MNRAVLLWLAGVAAALGQSATPAGSPTGANGSPSPVPIYDPGSEIVTWNGKSWNIENNRVFQARFEKYLSTPSDTDQDTTEHFQVMSTIRELLAPSQVSPRSQQEAFRLLEKASEYNADDLLSDAIGNQVYAAWLALKNTASLQAAARTLEEEKKRLEWNMRLVAEGDGLQHPHGSGTNSLRTLPGLPQNGREVQLQQIGARLAEVNAMLKNNAIKKEISFTEAKVDFQILIVQLFLQRRFHHVLIATRFYRAIFADGSSQQVKFGEKAQELFTNTTGHAPTLTALESLCGELIGDANDSVKAFRTLLAEKELESATKRLSEAFLIGEYLTPLDVISMPEKHQALVFLQKSHQLTSALEAKDYALAEKLMNDLQATANDFDTAKANAAIKTAKTTAEMHLQKARNAAAAGNKTTVEAELEAATAIWPTNPVLAEVATGIFNVNNTHARALMEFDQLVSQRSWRQIYNERMRFIPATAQDKDRQAKLEQVLNNIMEVDRTIQHAQDLEKRGEVAGAWEITEIAHRHTPEEYPRLEKYHAEFATRAAEYVGAIRMAEALEGKGERGSSLSWYLQAQMIYPQGELAKAGIQRLNHLILPDSW